MATLYRLDRALIEISGAEARTFLQDLLTQNLDRLDAEGIGYAALLSSQGKVVADMLLWPWDNGVLIDVDPARAAEVEKRLYMYKLRRAVTIYWTEEIGPVLWSPEPFEGSRRDPRLEALGWRSFANPRTDPAHGVETFESTRIALGVPDLAHDAQLEEVFAGEALLEELNGVAFDKGCFVGQENVSRMKRRGTTRKKFCPIVFDGEKIAFGEPILAGEAEIGTVRTGEAGRAIAFLRLDRAMDAVASGRPLSSGGREIRLDPPPWLILPQREDAPG